MVKSANKSAAVRVLNAFNFVSKHFALISVLIVAIAYFCAAIFLFGYLSFFDWRLIWVIEYSDVLKIGLLALSVISSFTIYFWTLADDFHAWREKTWDSIRVIMKSILALILFSLVVWTAHEYFGYQEPLYTYYILLHLSWTAIVLIGFSLIRLARILPNYSIRDAMGDIFIIFGVMYLFGLTLGTWVRDNNGFKHDVTLKSDVLKDVGVILITSHHVILYKDDLSIVVPTASVERIQSLKAKPRLKKSW